MFNNQETRSNDSSTSSENQSKASEKERDLQLFVKQMLLSRLFIGSFQEKRYVDSLQSYRDVISIASEEMELIRDMEVVRKRIRGFYSQDHWIGITGPDMVGAPAGHCVWVELPDEIFGNYWYKISKVKFRPNETLLRLKVIRPVAATDTSTNIKRLSIASPKDTDNEGTDRNTDVMSFQNLQNSFTAMKDVTVNSILSFMSTVMTIQNTKEAVKFTSVLFVAVVTGTVQLLEYLGDYSIKFMREFSQIIKAVTPIIIAFINLIGKIIGGFYLLILSMWRDRKGPPPVYQSPYLNRNPMITTGANDNGYGYNTVYFRRSLPQPSRGRYGGGVTITPLD